jgi:hypothetical protein
MHVALASSEPGERRCKYSSNKSEYLSTRLLQFATAAASTIRSDAALSCFKPRSNGTHSPGEIAFAYQTASQHDMNECQQLTLWLRNVAVNGLSKIILGSAPVECGKRPANGKAVAHCGQTCFPRWIRIGNAVTWRKYIPRLPLIA